MIVISLDFALTQVPEDANLPIIGYHNLAASGTVVSDTEETDYPLVNLFNPSTFLEWRGTETAVEETLTFTNADSSDIDYIGIARHNLGTGGFTVEVTATLAGSPVTLVEATAITDDEPLLFRFTKAAYSEIVIHLTPDGTAPSIAVLYVGELLVLERKIYVGHTPIKYGRNANVVVGMSTSGNFLGRLVLGEKRKSQIALSNLSAAWYRNYMQPFLDAALEDPFFFAWRPSGYPDEVGFCWMVGDGIPVNQMSNGRMQVTIDIEGIAS